MRCYTTPAPEMLPTGSELCAPRPAAARPGDAPARHATAARQATHRTLDSPHHPTSVASRASTSLNTTSHDTLQPLHDSRAPASLNSLTSLRSGRPPAPRSTAKVQIQMGARERACADACLSRRSWTCVHAACAVHISHREVEAFECLMSQSMVMSMLTEFFALIE